MPKIGLIGKVPADWSDNASQRTLFQQWPEVPGTDDTYLEPYGNPAYEGYGYPAAGYGQTRRTVVGLAQPKGVNPQLVGWEDPQPRGLRVTPRGEINPNSDRFSRAEIAVLQGLRGLGQAQKDLMSDVLPTPKVVEARRAAAWKIIIEMDRLYEVAQKAKPGAFSSALRSWAGMDAPVTALNRLLRDYYPVLRPNLIGQEGIFQKLNDVVKKPNRNWLAWVDAAKSLAREFNSAMGDVETYTLGNLIYEGTKDTLLQVAAGIQEGGERALTVLDWLTKPQVFIPAGLLVLGIYVYARSGGSFVSIRTGERK